MLDKRIIATGTTYGVGASVARALVEAGATVASMARTVESGQRQAAELTAAGPGTITFRRRRGYETAVAF